MRRNLKNILIVALCAFLCYVFWDNNRNSSSTYIQSEETEYKKDEPSLFSTLLSEDKDDDQKPKAGTDVIECPACLGSIQCVGCQGTGISAQGLNECSLCKGQGRCKLCGETGFVSKPHDVESWQAYNLMRQSFHPIPDGALGKSRYDVSYSVIDEECLQCHGTGKCYSCGGDGIRLDEGYSGNIIVSDCSICNGTGLCDRCHGRRKEK